MSARRKPGEGEPESYRLNVLLVSLAKLEERLGNQIEAFREEREYAQKHRHEMREVIAAMSQAVRTLTDRVEEMRPVVDDYRERRAEARGVFRLGHLAHMLGYLAAAAAGGLGAQGLHLLQ